MALLIRIDVDRPYGKHPLVRHVLSRLASDLFFPRVEVFGYLEELKVILRLLNDHRARSYVLFRRCTLPSQHVLRLLEEGRHEIGLHLEDSRSFETFNAEKQTLERHLGRSIYAFSKHGSGGARYGYHHHAPYEPYKYLEWGRKAGMKVFLGNLEDPSAPPTFEPAGLAFFPAAFWLEPHWRDTDLFTIGWLLSEARVSDIVLLIHPENLLESPDLTEQFKTVLRTLETKIVQ
jgi:hypothetical protein